MLSPTWKWATIWLTRPCSPRRHTGLRVVGVSLRMKRGWNLQAEMFRNQLNFTMNPENIFLLENGAALAGISPAAATLAA